jgi:L-glyceraldehyde 3-phosphate reductase
MAIQWLLNDERVTSVILGTSSVHQLEDNLLSIEGPDFTSDQLSRIEAIISRDGLTL